MDQIEKNYAVTFVPGRTVAAFLQDAALQVAATSLQMWPRPWNAPAERSGDGAFERKQTRRYSSNLRPFLNRLSGLLASGFGTKEIGLVLKKINKTKTGKKGDVVLPIISVFPVVFQRMVCPFTIRVIRDEVDALKVCFYAPPNFAKRISSELEKFNAAVLD